MMIGMTIDVVENSAWALRTAALGALVFDVSTSCIGCCKDSDPMTRHLRGSQRSTSRTVCAD
jgi:hypothetical protein